VQYDDMAGYLATITHEVLQRTFPCGTYLLRQNLLVDTKSDVALPIVIENKFTSGHSTLCQICWNTPNTLKYSFLAQEVR
jgi:hypothetical protein